MELKLFDSELKIMETLWNDGPLTAGYISRIMQEQIGWNRNTTYTVIKKLIKKGAVERSDPNFTCRALIQKEEVQRQEAEELISKLFNGSAELFLSSFLNGKELSDDEIERLKKIVEEHK